MGVVRTICTDCGMKWFFDAFHRSQPDVDMTSCGNCGGRLHPIDEDLAPAHPR
jgi:hypothetical protein